MGFWNWLTSGAKTAENATEIGKTVASGLRDGIDAIWYTDEEKAQHLIDGTKLTLDFWKTFAEENSIRSMTRRMLAIMSFEVFYFLVLASVAVYKFDPTFAGFIFGWVKELFWLWMMIAGTYFIPYQIAKVWKSDNIK